MHIGQSVAHLGGLCVLESSGIRDGLSSHHWEPHLARKGFNSEAGQSWSAEQKQLTR